MGEEEEVEPVLTGNPLMPRKNGRLVFNAHYPKIQIFVQKFNFAKNPKTQHFTSFSPNFFLTIFLMKSKLSTAKKSETITFSRVFSPKKNRQFSREIKVEFFDKK